MAAAAIEIGNRSYAQCIKASKKLRWDIDTDVIRDVTRPIHCRERLGGMLRYYHRRAA